MGMFDSVRVLAALPVDGEVARLGISWQDEIFQTKDLDNILGYYKITEDGRLMQSRAVSGWDEGENGADPKKTEGEEGWENIDFHGKIRFYTGYCDVPERRWDYSSGSEQLSWGEIMEVEGYDWWIEFEATFDSGRLREIRMMNPEKTLVRRRLANSKEWAERREAEAKKPCSIVLGHLKKVPGWRRTVRSLIKLEGAAHSAVSRALLRMA